MALTVSPAHAATKKPTPTPTAKVVAKSTAKPSISKKPVVKKKVVVKKKKKRKKITLSPSPRAAWPPVGFKANGEVYAKIPNAKELIGAASNSKSLTRQLAQKIDGVAICEKYSCGAVQVASLNGCTWWEITGKIVGALSPDDKTLKVFGAIRTTVGESAPKQITTILLISQELLMQKHAVANISAICHHDAPNEKVPGTTYSTSSN
ncbi:MAG: hypothetical protein F2690_05225 [Actinobacteria bacterium]|nr:hypothetical protein [Actinomycetota bacterium]MSX72316.1 hypothetical protein [Actinomycetota bacterium]MSY69948.1 hypothetical protein [Actinomycetota bacterium]MTA76315.1 hypothetical protein [Actinomycetota bacterium]